MHFGSIKINFYFVKRQAWQLEPIFEYQCFEKLAFKQILLSKIHLAIFGRTEGISDRFLSKV